jgi:hypothetical protein
VEGSQVYTVPLLSITVDHAIQPRCDGVDEAHVAALMESPETWPPITLFRRGTDLLLADGFHRHEAAKRLGSDALVAIILNAPEDGDLARAAFEFNLEHGRALTHEDKKARARRLLDEHPELSDREIGRQTRLHHETVGDLRRAMSAGTWRAPIHKPGGIEPDIGGFDPIRRGRKATRAQKAVAGYIKRLVDGIEEPYRDEGAVAGWSDDPAALAQACVAAMGSERAARVLASLEYRARFLAQIGKAHKSLSKSPEETRT